MQYFFPLVVCAHDAGAANLIAGWLSNISKDSPIYLYAEGPARKLLTARIPHIQLCSDWISKNPAMVLTGTSGPTIDLEHQTRYIAQQKKIFSVAVVDHWINYPKRFSRHGQTVLPDELWVSDDLAANIALANFPSVQVKMYPNTYVEDILVSIRNSQGHLHQGTNVLYLFEPMHSDWGIKGSSGEFQAFNYFLAKLDKLKFPPPVTIRLRPHPSDPEGKYLTLLGTEGKAQIEIDPASSLGDSLSWASYVVGCESYAMHIALLAGKKVIGSLPPWAPNCRLPHQGILHLKDAIL